MRKTLIRPLLGALAISLVAAACTPLGTTGPISGPYSKSIWGVDVSNYQHPYGRSINWTSVRQAGARFAFVKVSEGSNYVNPYEASDISGAHAAGLEVGGYHFARPRLPLSTATSDARQFAALLGNLRTPGYLPPVLDMETTGGLSAANVTAWTRTFLSALQTASGRVPMIYTGGWFWTAFMGNPTGFSQYPLWVGEYTPQNSGPDLFGDFAHSTFWQYTDAAQVSGISGAVDASWFHGSLAQLSSLAYTMSSVNTSATTAKTNGSNAMHLFAQQASPGSPAAAMVGSATTGGHMAQNPAVLGK